MDIKSEELVKGCQRYLDELEKRNLAAEKLKEEKRLSEEHKAARREYWRELLYADNQKGITVIIPDNSKTD